MQFDSLCVKKQGELYATGEETGNRGMAPFLPTLVGVKKQGDVQHLYNICITSKGTGGC